MEAKFLTQVVNSILEKYESELAEIAIVLPNVRSAKVFTQTLKKNARKSLILPDIFTLNNFVETLSSKYFLQEYELLLQLWKAFQLVPEAQSEFSTFEEFLPFSKIILADFSQILLAEVDDKKFFSWLTDIAEVETWGIDLNATEEKKLHYKFLNLWSFLGKIYENFTQNLENYGFFPLELRNINQNFQEFHQNLNWKKLIYLPKNQVSKSEKTFMNHLKNESLLEIYLDEDKFFTSEKSATPTFFTKNPDFFREIVSESTKTIEKNAKNAKIYSAPSNLAQLDLCIELIQKEQLYSDTAIILGDQILLSPLVEKLFALDSVEQFNYLGTLLIEAEVYQFFRDLLQFYANNFDEIYTTELVKILENPFFETLLCCSDYGFVEDFIQKVKYNHIKKLSWQAFHKEIHLKIHKFLPQITDLKDFPRYLESILLRIHDKSIDNITQIVAEKLYSALQKVNSGKTFELTPDFASFSLILLTIVEKEIISYGGEIDKGIQILSFEESLLLDFEHVILISMNEGTIPSNARENSLIPFELKKYFNLPNSQTENEKSAYLFYRLFQRSKSVHLIYNASIKQGNKGKSRFIYQILYEFLEKTEDAGIQHFTIDAVTENSKLQIQKDAIYREKIQAKFESGISASMLNTYLRSPIEFYQQYVLNVKEPEVDPSVFQNNTFGSFLHKILELSYEKLEGEIIEVSDYQLIIDEISKKNEEAKECEDFRKINWKNPRNLLLENVGKEIIKKTLEYDRDNHAPFEILGREQELTVNLELENGESVKLKGFIDRIDRKNGEIHVIDYKSGAEKKGNYKLNFLSEESSFDEQKEYFRKFPIHLQLLVYRKFIIENDFFVNDSSEIHEKPYFLRKINNSLKTYRPKKITLEEIQEMDEVFTQFLTKLVEEIQNPEIPLAEL